MGYIEGFEKDADSNLNERKDSNKSNEEIHQYNKCNICDRIFINKSQWTCNFFLNFYSSYILKINKYIF